MDYQQLNQDRRSINFFDPEASIRPEDIRAIFDRAKFAPSSFNFQPWKIVVALSPESKEGLRKVAMNQPKVTEASAVLVMIGNTRQYEESEDVLRNNIERGLLTEEAIPHVVNMARNLYKGREAGYVSRNIGLFAMNFMLAAKDLGWETHPMDGFDVDGVRKYLGLDEKYLPVMFIAIGRPKPDLKLAPRGIRRSFDQVVEIR